MDLERGENEVERTIRESQACFNAEHTSVQYIVVPMMASKPEVDQFIGYEIPVEFTNDDDVPEQEENYVSPTFINLDALNIGGPSDETRFELMEIHITLYTLSGILYHAKKPMPYKKFLSLIGRGCNLISSCSMIFVL